MTQRIIDLSADESLLINTPGGMHITVGADGQVTVNTAGIGPWSVPANNNYKIGERVLGKGIYFGVWSPVDRAGRSLGKTFNLFADAADQAAATYNEALKTGKIKYKNDAALYAALKDGRYKDGEGFLPPRELLNGTNIQGKTIQTDNLYAHKDQGALRGTFNETAASGSDDAQWYWSCSEARDDSSKVIVDFTDGIAGRDLKDNNSLSSRLVRAELRL